MAKAKTGVVNYYRCETPDDRCARPYTPTFLPGISVRHSPSCTGAICGIFACDGGNWRLNSSEGTLDRSRWVEGWVMTQLLTRAYVECDEHPLGQRGGGWWADAFRNDRFRSGSKLWILQWRGGGATNELLLLAKDYTREALQPLVQWGIANQIDIAARYITRGAKYPGAIMHLEISVKGPGVEGLVTLEGNALPNAKYLWTNAMPPQVVGRLPGRHYVPARAA